MRTEHEPPRSVAAPLPELDAEREIDFGRIGRTIASRWWIVVGTVLVGALLGWLASLGGGEVYVARTTLYLGQPTSPTGSTQVPSLATNPATVNEIVRSDAVVAEVAGTLGVQPSRLRRGISTRTITATGTASARQQQQNPLVQISVRGPWSGQRTAEAANLLGQAVVTEVSGYVDAKVDALEARLESQQRELTQIDRRIDDHQRALGERGLSTLERLTLLNLMGLAEQRRGLLIEDRTDTEQLITLAEEVERARQVTEARASRVPAQSPRSAILVGALLGLLVGLVLALLWHRIAPRRLRA